MIKSLIKNTLSKIYNKFKINTSDALVFDESDSDEYPICIENKFLKDYNFNDNQYCCNVRVSANNDIKYYNIYESGIPFDLQNEQIFSLEKVLSVKDFEKGNDGIDLVSFKEGGDNLVNFKVHYYGDCPIIEFQRSNEISEGIYSSYPEGCVLMELYHPLTEYPFIYSLLAQDKITNGNRVRDHYNGNPIFFSGISGNFYIQDSLGNLHQYFRFK